MLFFCLFIMIFGMNWFALIYIQTITVRYPTRCMDFSCRACYLARKQNSYLIVYNVNKWHIRWLIYVIYEYGDKGGHYYVKSIKYYMIFESKLWFSLPLSVLKNYINYFIPIFVYICFIFSVCYLTHLHVMNVYLLLTCSSYDFLQIYDVKKMNK